MGERRRRRRRGSVDRPVAALAWYVGSFADFTSASGALTVFLVLAAFLYTASIIFLVGIEIDELLRKDASAGEEGIIGVLRRGMTGALHRGTTRD